MKEPKAKFTEHQLQNTILEYLRWQGIFAWRNNSGAVFSEYKGKKRMVRFGLKGSADILGVMPGGTFLAIEVKGAKGIVSPEQQEFLDQVNNRHGLGFIAWDLDDVVKMIKDYGEEDGN